MLPGRRAGLGTDRTYYDPDAAPLSAGSGISLMAAVRLLPRLQSMIAEHPVQRVEVSFTGTPPVRQIERASGVSEVDVDGPIVRCLVTGSFQPFLEALRGHEVITLQSTLAAGPQASSTRAKKGP
jgi:hypothetical protein